MDTASSSVGESLLGSRRWKSDGAYLGRCPEQHPLYHIRSLQKLLHDPTVLVSDQKTIPNSLHSPRKPSAVLEPTTPRLSKTAPHADDAPFRIPASVSTIKHGKTTPLPIAHMHIAQISLRFPKNTPILHGIDTPHFRPTVPSLHHGCRRTKRRRYNTATGPGSRPWKHRTTHTCKYGRENESRALRGPVQGERAGGRHAADSASG